MNAEILNGHEHISFKVRGSDGPWIVMSHSLGCCKDMWEPQIEYFSRSYRVLTYDLPGHGDSSPSNRHGSLNFLAKDLMTLLDALAIEKVHFIGISIGGMIGQVAALANPGRFASLVLANTSSKMPEMTHPDWMMRIKKAKEEGVGTLAMPSLERWFTPNFRANNPGIIKQLANQFSKTTTSGYVECCEAIMALSTQEELPMLDIPTLVITGSKDLGSPVVVAQALANQIKNSKFEVIDDAGHLSSIDHSVEFNEIVKAFLEVVTAVTNS